MAGKENSDLFSHLSSNEGSLPLDFDKKTGDADHSKGEAAGKTETSESSSIKSHPKAEKGESQRRPTHHSPPPYKNTVQETESLEPKNNVEAKSDITVQDKLMAKPEVEPVTAREEVKPAPVTVEAVQAPVPAKLEFPVTALTPVAAPVSTVIPASAPIVEPSVSPVSAQVEKSPETAPAPKRVRHPKTQPVAKTESTEKQLDPVMKMTHDTKTQVPDVNQKEVPASASPVPTERKVLSEQKVSKAEPHKPVKKTGVSEKFSADNATAGQLLQEGRVRSGLSIDQVSISTKIKKTFIESMERDDFENLPASVYVNAYARSLCSLYNIDNKLIFSLLNKVKGKNLAFTVPEEVIHQLEKGKQVNIVQETKVKRFFLIGFAACFTIAACISITYYFMHVSTNASSSTTNVKPSINPELPAHTGTPIGTSTKTLEEEMGKKLVPPHIFTMTSLPLAER